MDKQRTDFRSTALQMNLGRTAAVVEIHETYLILLEVAKEHYGVLKRTRKLQTARFAFDQKTETSLTGARKREL